MLQGNSSWRMKPPSTYWKAEPNFFCI